MSGSRTSGGSPQKRTNSAEPSALNGRQSHAVETAGRRAGRRVQIGVAIEPEQAEVFVVAARAGEQCDDQGAVTAKDEHETAGLYGQFSARLQVMQGSHDVGQVPGALVLVIVGKQVARRSRRNR